MTTRNPRTPKVFLTKTPTGERLIKALSSQGAIKYATAGTHTAALASQGDLVRLLPGVKVEDATAEEVEA